MKKAMKNILLMLVTIALLASFAGCDQQGSSKGKSPLTVNTVQIVPAAYLDEPYDLLDIILTEEGVEYSATACYVEYVYNEGAKQYTANEQTVAVNGLCFTPTSLNETVVTITAVRGKETSSKTVYIPTSIHAEPLDELYQSNGILGYADSGISKSINLDPQFIHQEDSVTSLRVEFNGKDPHAFGNAFLELSNFRAQEIFTDKVWDNAIITFWVFNPMEKDVEFQLVIVDNTHAEMRDWNNNEGPHRQFAKAGQWTQIFFSLRNLGTKHKIVKDEFSSEYMAIKMQYADFDMENAYSYHFYLDNLDVVPASTYPEIDCTYTMSDEKLDQGWENMSVDIGWQGANTIYDYEHMNGEGSICSMKATFPGEKGKTNSFICLNPEAVMELKGKLDMTGGKFSGYFKFENMPAKVTLDLINSKWEVSNAVDFSLKDVGNGWYYGEIDMNSVRIGSGRSDNIVRIRLNFEGIKDNSVVYVDTLKYDYEFVDMRLEPISSDWINLPLDQGMTVVNSNKYTSDRVKAKGSVRSVQVVAPGNQAGVITFNTELAVINGDLPALPNMTKGTVHAYFYFGNQDPQASLKLANEQWKASKEVNFIFESVGGGWYYGTIPAGLLQGYEEGNGSKIIRMMVSIPAGYNVYIDGLMHYPNEEYASNINPEDLFASGIFTQNNFTSGSGAEITTEVTNGSKDAIHIWADKKVGWPNVGISFATPVDISVYEDISLDVKTQNAWKWMEIKLFYMDASGVEQVSSVGVDFTQEDWQTVTKKLSVFKNANLKKVTGILICVNFDDGFQSDGRNELWFDNMRLSDGSNTPDLGEPFAAGSEKQIELDQTAKLETLSFDYQITNDGTLAVAALNADWSKYYGYYEFNSEGSAWDYSGVACEKLDNGYIRVTMTISQLSRTNNTDNRDNAPDVIASLYISANMNTADGYINNISYVVDDGNTPDDPTEPSEPEETEPTEPVHGDYDIAVGLEIDVEDGAYDYITFEYQLTDSGTLAIAALSPDWGKYYGYYEFDKIGKIWEDNGVYAEKLDDGFVRVTLVTAEMDRTNNSANANNRPEQIGLLYIGNANTATGVIRNVICGTGEVDVPSEPTEPEVTEPEITEPEGTEPAPAYSIAANLEIDFEDGTYDYISFEYQITNDGTLFIAALSPDWGKYFGYYELNADGKVWEDNGVYCEKMEDGFVRVILKTEEMDRTNNSANANNKPEQIGLLYTANYNTAAGTIRNVICGVGDTSEPTEPTEPEATEPEVTEPEITEPTPTYSIAANLEIDIEDGTYDYISFEYQITNDGTLYIAALSPDWGKYFGYYELNADGKVWEDNGVYCEKLDDGFVRVILKTSEMDRTNNSPNADNKPSAIGLLFVANYNTATGTIRNVSNDCIHIFESIADGDRCVVCGEKREEKPADSVPTYNIATGLEIDVEDGAYDYISFEYKVEGDGILYIAALSPDWGKYFGYYEFNASGKIWEDNGIYTEVLSDGYIRITLKTAELERTNNAYNTNNVPDAIGLLYIGNGNTATGTIRNVQCGNGGSEPQVRSVLLRQLFQNVECKKNRLWEAFLSQQDDNEE